MSRAGSKGKAKKKEEKRKRRLTGKYRGVRDSFWKFDRQSVVGDVQSVVRISENANGVTIAALRIRVLQYQTVVVHQLVALLATRK